MMVVPMPWSSVWLFSPRTSAMRCMCFAVCGSSSQNAGAGHGGRDRLERPAGVGVRLRIPGFKLADAARQEDDEHALLRSSKCRVRAGRGEPDRTQRGRGSAEPRNARRETR